MPPRNPSELARLEEERLELIAFVKANKGMKAAKEAALRELRKIEKTLGIEGKNYNSSDF